MPPKVSKHRLPLILPVYANWLLSIQRKRVDAEPDVTSAPTASARTTRGSAAKANEGVIKEPAPKKSTTKTSASAKASKTAVAE